MAGSVHTHAHNAIVQAFVAERRRVGLKQADLADRIGKDQSFISNIERGQRRIDTLETVVIARALGLDPIAFFTSLISDVPADTRL